MQGCRVSQDGGTAKTARRPASARTAGHSIEWKGASDFRTTIWKPEARVVLYDTGWREVGVAGGGWAKS